jgi:hypothetical protein
MIKEAVKTDKAVLAADKARKAERTRVLRQQGKRPFSGSECNYVEIDDYVLAEGYAGPITINKLYYRKVMYGLVEPVTIDMAKIYGVFRKNNPTRILEYVTDAKVGMHLRTELPSGGRSGLKNICLKHLGREPATFAQMKKQCLEIVKALETINLHSYPGMTGSKKKYPSLALVEKLHHHPSDVSRERFRDNFKRLL